MADMEAIYNDETGLNEDSGIMSLLRGAGDAVFGPEIMDNLPVLLRAMQNTNKDTLTMEQMRDMSGPLDESSLSVRLSNTPGLEESIGPELALMLGMASPGGKGKGIGSIFDMLKDSLDPSTIKRYDDKEFMDFQKGVENIDDQLSGKTVGKDEFAELDAMIERGLKPKVDRPNTPEARFSAPTQRYELLDQEAKDELQRIRNIRAKLIAELDQDMSLDINTMRNHERRIATYTEQLRPFFPDIDRMSTGGRPGLYANIHAKRKRIAAGSGERMRKKGEEGAPTAANFRQAAKTAKKSAGGALNYKQGYYGKSYK